MRHPVGWRDALLFFLLYETRVLFGDQLQFNRDLLLNFFAFQHFICGFNADNTNFISHLGNRCA